MRKSPCTMPGRPLLGSRSDRRWLTSPRQHVERAVADELPLAGPPLELARGVARPVARTARAPPRRGRRRAGRRASRRVARSPRATVLVLELIEVGAGLDRATGRRTRPPRTDHRGRRRPRTGAPRRATGTSVAPSAEVTRYSRATSWADGVRPALGGVRSTQSLRSVAEPEGEVGAPARDQRRRQWTRRARRRASAIATRHLAAARPPSASSSSTRSPAIARTARFAIDQRCTSDGPS